MDTFAVARDFWVRQRFVADAIGNSVDSTLDAHLTMTLLGRGEEYTVTMPDYHVKG